MSIIVIVEQVEARKNIEDFGIVLSRNCITDLKLNGENSTCPTYNEIMVLYPDTSNKQVSGDFSNKTGILEREYPQFKQNHFAYYEFLEPVMWIDPPGDIRDKIRIIEIRQSMPDYLIRDASKEFSSYRYENNTLVLGHSRYVDDRCAFAAIDSSQWELLLGDTFFYMQKECDPNHTNYDHYKKIYSEPLEHDVSSSYKWFLDNWFEKAKALCKAKCFEY